MDRSPFPAPGNGEAQELGETLAPKFDANGLISAIVQDFRTGEVLMLAHMNAEALSRTLETGQSHFWSRSRQELWHKGATSGDFQTVREIRIDCDQDAVLLRVEVATAAACHTGRRSCFYRLAEAGGSGPLLRLIEPEPKS